MGRFTTATAYAHRVTTRPLVRFGKSVKDVTSDFLYTVSQDAKDIDAKAKAHKAEKQAEQAQHLSDEKNRVVKAARVLTGKDA